MSFLILQYFRILHWFQEEPHPDFSLNACLKRLNSLGVQCQFLAGEAGEDDGDMRRDTVLWFLLFLSVVCLTYSES